MSRTTEDGGRHVGQHRRRIPNQRPAGLVNPRPEFAGPGARTRRIAVEPHQPRMLGKALSKKTVMQAIGRAELGRVS